MAILQHAIRQHIRILLIKGTRYPINLTREKEQHICPMCARNSCLGDYCPDCNLKY